MHANDVYPLYGAMHEILVKAGWQDGKWTPMEFVGTGSPPAELARELPGEELFNTAVGLSMPRRLSRRLPGNSR